jgi:hypothetical protein
MLIYLCQTNWDIIKNKAEQVVECLLPHFWITDVHRHFVNAAPDTNEQKPNHNVVLKIEIHVFKNKIDRIL